MNWHRSGTPGRCILHYSNKNKVIEYEKILTDFLEIYATWPLANSTDTKWSWFLCHKERPLISPKIEIPHKKKKKKKKKPCLPQKERRTSLNWSSITTLILDEIYFLIKILPPTHLLLRLSQNHKFDK